MIEVLELLMKVSSSSWMEVVEVEMVVAWPQHHGDLVELWGQFLMAMELLCLKLEIQCVVSGDFQFLAELSLDCMRTVVDRSRLYQSCLEPGVELGEEVGLPSFSNCSFQYSFVRFQTCQALALQSFLIFLLATDFCFSS